MTTKRPNSLRHYRLKRRLTQQEVMKALGHASPSRLSAWENGESVPSTPHLVKLSELYRVPIHKLVGGFARKKERPAPALEEALPKPAREAESEYRKLFGKEYGEMSPEELVEIFAEIIVDAYLHSKGIDTSEKRRDDESAFTSRQRVV